MALIHPNIADIYAMVEGVLVMEEGRRSSPEITEEVVMKKSENSHRSQKAPAPIDYYARYELLIAIRNHWPAFWRDLRDLIKQPSPSKSLETFLADHSILSRDSWFLSEVLLPTIESWRANPESPNARLEPCYPWFTFHVSVTIPDFRPVFSDPRVRVKKLPEELAKKKTPSDPGHLLGGIVVQIETETFEEFEHRMTEQFQDQLQRYRKTLENIFGARSLETRKHAAWTALTLAGKTGSEIANDWPGMRLYENAEKAIYRAVKRFMSRVGLMREHDFGPIRVPSKARRSRSQFK